MNNLFPVFLKLDAQRVLVIGGGKVAVEKVTAIVTNAPTASIRLVAPDIDARIRALAAGPANLVLAEREYRITDLDDAGIVMIAVDNPELSAVIRSDAHERRLLVNVADTPSLCDFYLGSIVRKGDLKIAISTNGRSPTIAKRLREVLSEVIPEEIDDLLANLQQIRSMLRGDFASKVRRLNRITSMLAATTQTTRTSGKCGGSISADS